VQVQRRGERAQGPRLDVEQLEGKRRALVGAVDRRAQGLADGRQMLLDLPQDLGELRPGRAAAGLRRHAHAQDAREVGEAPQAHVGGRELRGWRETTRARSCARYFSGQ